MNLPDNLDLDQVKDDEDDENEEGDKGNTFYQKVINTKGVSCMIHFILANC